MTKNKKIKLEDEKGWETVFSAKKHNRGKGIEVSKLIKILEKLETIDIDQRSEKIY